MKALALCACLVLAAPLAAQAAPPVAAAHAARFNLDTPIETLMANPAAKAVVDRHMPDLADNPHYFMFKHGSLRDLSAHMTGDDTKAALAKIEAELAKVP